MFDSGLNEHVCPQYVWLWYECACCLTSVCLTLVGMNLYFVLSMFDSCLNERIVCPQLGNLKKMKQKCDIGGQISNQIDHNKFSIF